jgi:hypothetical protein
MYLLKISITRIEIIMMNTMDFRFVHIDGYKHNIHIGTTINVPKL